MVSTQNYNTETIELSKFLKLKKSDKVSIIKKIINLFIFMTSKIRLCHKVTKYDSLYLLDSSILYYRHKKIIDKIEEMGISCKVIIISRKLILFWGILGAFYKDSIIDSSRFACEKSFALFLKNKFSPKLIFQSSDSAILSTFLKRMTGAKLINIAHCVSCNSQHFDFFDFHYYFIFGKSSLSNLRKINVSYGSTNVVEIGSLFLSASNSVVRNKKNNDRITVLFSSSWIPKDSILLKEILWARSLILELAEKNSQILIVIKPHPLETNSDWISGYSNIILAKKNNDIHELLNNVNYHITNDSAFSLEASIAHVPTIVIKSNINSESCLNFKSFFPIVNTQNELKNLIFNYDSNRYKIEEFVNFHFSIVENSLNIFTENVSRILESKKIDGNEFLSGKFKD